MCYTISVDRRDADHLPLKLPLKVCALSPMVILSHRSLSEGLFAHLHLLSMASGWWCSRLLNGVHSHFLPYDGDRPVTAWKENTHASWRDDSMTVEKTLAARK